MIEQVRVDREVFGNGENLLMCGSVMKLPDGRLIMTWSSWSEQAYAVGVADSASGRLAGPWIQRTEPLYPANGGHGMLFTEKDGSLWFTLHSPNDKYLERPAFYAVETEGGLRLK